MLKFFLGIVVGYAAREELRRIVKGTVKGVVRLQGEVQSSYVALKEDVSDAVIEERATRRKPTAVKP